MTVNENAIIFAAVPHAAILPLVQDAMSCLADYGIPPGAREEAP
jgi:hypothetical protein